MHGCGGVGLSAIMIATALGANVIAIDICDEKLAFAKSIGAHLTLNASQATDLVAEIKTLSQGGVHVSVDALGSHITCRNSILNLRKRGRHIQVGLMAGADAQAAIPIDRVISDELEIYGSHGMQAHRYPELLNMIKSGKLAPELLIGRTISLSQSVTELPKMDEFKGVGVTVIDRFK